MPNLRSDARVALALLGLVAAVYLPSLWNGFVYDDHEVIVAQPRPASASDLGRLFAEPHFRGLPYYRPIVRASLLAQKGVHGDRPALFHLGNALLAGATAAAAFALLRAPAFRACAAPAAVAATLFAVHPVASSTVYPIASGRETLLPALFILVAVASWVRARRIAAAVALAAALLAKEQAVVTPLLFVLADLCGVSCDAPALRRDAFRAWFRRYAAPVALVLAYFTVRSAVLPPGVLTLAVLEDPLAPALSFAFGLQAALAPFASLHYEPEVAGWLSPTRLGVAAALLSGIVALSRVAQAPPLRIWSFWIGWFVVMQIPTANLLRQEARFDERYAFVALLAFPAVIAAAISALPSPRRGAAIAGFAAATALLAVVTIGRSATFRDDARFATQWLRTAPDVPEAHHLLGMIALQDAHYDEAVVHLEAALRGAPASPDLLTNLGVALAKVGREAEARERLEAALLEDPEHPEAHSALGTLLARAGRSEDAIEHHRAAVRAAPRLAAAHMNLGVALARAGRWDAAVSALREAVRLDPASVEAQRNLAAALRAQADTPAR
jgi:Flp pilus assembly protein TadD